MATPPSSSLAQLVRQFRLHAELSQGELAERSGLSARQISDLERGLRVLPRIETLRMLADGLGLSDSHRATLFAAARPDLHTDTDTSPALPPVFPARHPWDQGIPAPASDLIGRDELVEHVVAELASGKHRLITLTGPGGVGKTRLALEATSVIRERREMNARFLPLASILDPGLVAQAIGRAFGLHGADAQTLPERLAVELADHRFLLVLDNFEQILQAAPLVAQIVNACPKLHALVTSRTHLNLSSEHIIPIAPLELPSEGASRREIAAAPAVSLFLERSAMPEASVTDEGAAAIATICRRIDGLPLAIELAAAKMRILSPADLLDRMDRSLPLLEGGPRDAPARLQTMRNAIAWSYDLLSTEEQRLLRFLSVFQGGFTLEAAEGVVSESPATPFLPLFQSLVNSSLVQRMESATDSTRYTMLETVKEFGIDELDRHGEERDARDRHLAWYCGQIGPLSPEHRYSHSFATKLLLPNEHDNLRVALNWALDGRDLDAAVQMAFGLRTYWRRNGFFQEAEAVLDRIASHSESLDPIIASAVMAWLATFTFQLGDFPKTRALETEGLRICRERGFPIGIRDHLCGLGIVTKWSDGPAALRMISEAIAIGETLGDKLSIANDYHKRAFTYLAYGEIDRADGDLARMFDILAESPDAEPVRGYATGAAGWIAGLRRDYALAERLSHEAVELASEQGIAEMQTWSLRALGEIAFAKGELNRAAGCYQEALRLAYRSALRIWEGFCYANLAAVAFRQGDRRRAALLFGAADANWEYLGIVPAARVGIVAWSHQGFPPAEAMADTRFAANFAAGKQLSRAEVYAEAMAVGSDQDAAPDRGAILSVRQLEVLQQMSEGHTNREIAEALFVSKRTVDGHVASILSKLGVDTRREAVAMARQGGLLVESPAESGSTG